MLPTKKYDDPIEKKNFAVVDKLSQLCCLASVKLRCLTPFKKKLLSDSGQKSMSIKNVN